MNGAVGIHYRVLVLLVSLQKVKLNIVLKDEPKICADLSLNQFRSRKEKDRTEMQERGKEKEGKKKKEENSLGKVGTLWVRQLLTKYTWTHKYLGAFWIPLEFYFGHCVTGTYPSRTCFHPTHH